MKKSVNCGNMLSEFDFSLKRKDICQLDSKFLRVKFANKVEKAVTGYNIGAYSLNLILGLRPWKYKNWAPSFVN